jgi:hypothetical protein
VKGVRTVQYFISDNPTYNGDPDTDSNWTKIIEGEFADANLPNDMNSTVIPGVDAQGQYLLLYLPDSYDPGRPYVAVAEVTAFGKVE